MPMKHLLPALFLCLLTICSQAQDDSPEQEMLEKLFGEHRDLASLDAVIKEAAEKKIPQQTLNEARFLFHIRSETESELPKLIKQFDKSIASYNPKEAVITQTANEWKALVTFCRAMDALNKKDQAGFKKHITEAFWLNPGNAEIFGTPIQTMRNREAMAKMVVDLNTELLDSVGKPTKLATHMEGKKAILIDFWASWCQPCMELMPELKAKAELLEKHGIVVIGLNTEGDPTIAAGVQKKENVKFPWLVEPKTEVLSQLFQVDSIPRMVLVNPDGKVLFNSHPMNPDLWVALRKIAPEIEVPKE